MRIETIRATADWLKDETNGVNALLPGVPRDSTDELPPLLATGPDELACVYDATRHLWVRKRTDPPNLPCLYVMSEQGFEVHGEEMTGDHFDTKTPCIITIRYLASKNDEEQATQDGEYTLRAVKQSLRRFMLQDFDTNRTRNGVGIMSLLRVMYYPITASVGESMVAGAVAAYFDLRDTNP